MKTHNLAVAFTSRMSGCPACASVHASCHDPGCEFFHPIHPSGLAQAFNVVIVSLREMLRDYHAAQPTLVMYSPVHAVALWSGTACQAGCLVTWQLVRDRKRVYCR
jgi:hypothetical protein